MSSVDANATNSATGNGQTARVSTNRTGSAPRPRLSAFAVVVVVSIALVFYLATVGHRGWLLLASGRVPMMLLGLGVVLLPVIGAYALVRELRFGQATARLARRAPGAGSLDFDECRQAVEAAPSSWVAWFDLARAYGQAGDTARGRAAMRRALALADSEDAAPPR